MEFKTLALLILSVIVLVVLVLLSISLSRNLGDQVNNASNLLRF